MDISGPKNGGRKKLVNSIIYRGMRSDWLWFGYFGHSALDCFLLLNFMKNVWPPVSAREERR